MNARLAAPVALSLTLAACDGPIAAYCGGDVIDACAKARDLATVVSMQLADEAVADGNAIIAEGGALNDRAPMELSIRAKVMSRNTPSVDNVTVFLGPIPPPAGVDAVVLMYRRNVLESQNPGLLSQPIGRTLPGSGRRIEPGLMPADVARRVDQLTRSNLYYGVYQLIGGRDALLQLQPFPKG